jgi:hypothetical protein
MRTRNPTTSSASLAHGLTPDGVGAAGVLQALRGQSFGEPADADHGARPQRGLVRPEAGLPRNNGGRRQIPKRPLRIRWDKLTAMFGGRRRPGHAHAHTSDHPRRSAARQLCASH